MSRWRRIKNRWWLLTHASKALNRRAVVERYLWNAAAGKQPLPDADKCRELALKLGMPDE